MPERVRPLALMLWLLLPCASAFAAPADSVRFAAEDWPPFITPTLPGHGLSGTLVSAVYEKLGQSARVEYFPWKRTMEFGLHHPRYAGFMAVWRTPEREKLCHFSAPIGNTQTVLVFLKDAPLQASGLAELTGMRIGTVAGYSNGEQFDGMARQGLLRAEEGVNDEINLRKLLSKRFPAIVVEKHVLRHLLYNSGRFTKAERERITFSEQAFKERPVHICFKRTAEGLAQQKAYNDAAREIDLAKFEREYWRRIGMDGNQAVEN
ncbi:ABC transporter substrate-binding protein [Massilia sp. YIM B04103]|uniref:substrate-binding periplasmic protein n=1 Tax=Massilia sp. YIM B04103 TaxID=2963106 RepID=UPI00210CD691|nr:transporter substrate-binding domain-containing protein [Massilia sp. YIM B04103]